MRNRYSIGDTVRFTLDLIFGGGGQPGELPIIAIQRADGQWFTGTVWQVAYVENSMVETDATNLPGRYHFDFDHTLDPLVGTAYLVKKQNRSEAAALEYEDAFFGPQAATTAFDICAVTGTIFTPQGLRARSELVRASLIPVFKDGMGRSIQSDNVQMVATDTNGDFSIPLVRGGTFRLEIPSIGYDRKVVIPDAPTALFTAL